MNESDKSRAIKLWETLQLHPAVVFSKFDINNGEDMPFLLVHDHNNIVVVTFFKDDLWMMMDADGEWRQCIAVVEGESFNNKNKYEYKLTISDDDLGLMDIYTEIA